MSTGQLHVEINWGLAGNNWIDYMSQSGGEPQREKLQSPEANPKAKKTFPLTIVLVLDEQKDQGCII